jgi:hypothetical protein
MFTRPRFSIAQTSDGVEMLAVMAHAMGCATLVDAPRQPVATIVDTGRLTATPIVASHPPAALRVQR